MGGPSLGEKKEGGGVWTKRHTKELKNMCTENQQKKGLNGGGVQNRGSGGKKKTNPRQQGPEKTEDQVGGKENKRGEENLPKKSRSCVLEEDQSKKRQRIGKRSSSKTLEEKSCEKKKRGMNGRED